MDFKLIHSRVPTLAELQECEQSWYILVNVVKAPKAWSVSDVFDRTHQRGFVAGYLAASGLPPSAYMTLVLCHEVEDPEEVGNILIKRWKETPVGTAMQGWDLKEGLTVVGMLERKV